MIERGRRTQARNGPAAGRIERPLATRTTVMSEPFPDLPDLPGDLQRLLAQIPPGRVATYGGLADALGNRIAARWVGHFMLHHEHTAGCACHRVVRARGRIGEYIAGGSRSKAKRLAAEGVEVRQGSVELARW